MELIQLYNELAIKQIYSNLLQLSIYNYQMLSDEMKKIYHKPYQNAVFLQEQLDVPPFETPELILEFLNSVQESVEEISSKNQPTIDLYTEQIEQMLIDYIPDRLHVIEKLEFIFDFITKWISYSEDAFCYCFHIPPTNGFFFDFYQGIPISQSYAGLVVTRQGLCGDISNLLVHLARLFHIEVQTVTCMHGDNSHMLNAIELEDGSLSYIDATACIRGLKTKEEAFLVSKEKLNQDQDYDLEDKSSVTLKKCETCPYSVDDFISFLPVPPVVSIHHMESVIKN